ncbi:MAG TPA: hypothetical protein VNR20_03465 [Terriglobales bacterium]|nr:hypothetical protein [Terriglobales bacterium]
MLRLTQNNRAIAEIVAVSEHIASLTAAAAAFQLTPDVPAPRTKPTDTPMIPLVDQTSAGDAAATLEQIGDWAKQALGIGHIPGIWRALANDPKLLAATWRKDQLVLAAGTLDELVKGCVALAIAQFRQSPYWIAYLTQYLRTRCGADNRLLVEIAGAVMHYVSFNTIAHGMRLDPPFSAMDASDVASGGRFEHLVPGVRRRLSSST